MAIEIVMPRLGWTMDEGTLVEWIKHDGDTVQPGDIMFTVESDKALNEVESFESGIFRIPPDSDVVGKALPIGTVLAYIVQPGETAPFEQLGHSGSLSVVTMIKTSPNTAMQSPKMAPSRVDKTGNESNPLPAISPRARRVAKELGLAWTNLKGSGRSGRIVERDIRAAAELVNTTSSARLRASPVAKRVAEELGVDVAALAAQMPGQRITREYVERAAQSTVAPTSSLASQNEVRSPISRLRHLIAERMSTSAHTTAPVTLTTEVDATDIVKLRQGMKAASRSDTRPLPSYSDLLAKLVAEALLKHPYLNARIENDTIVSSKIVNMGFAVDTERGLIVPVIHNVQAKSIRQIAAESAVLSEKARNGKLLVDELSGGTFTITNLGMYEIDAFTPIINIPQCAILGIGRIIPKQVVIDVETEQLAIRQMMFLSLTFDHRLVDGAPAARFLQEVKHFIEQPLLWLLN